MKLKQLSSQLVRRLLFLLICVLSYANAQSQNWLSAKGNQLYDASGKEVRLTGLNYFGFETAQFKFHGLWSRDMKSALKQIKDLGFNCIRIPWTDAMLKPTATIQIDSYGSDPYTGVTPMNGDIKNITKPIDLLDEVVKWCQANNMKVILDNHARIADGYLSESVWYSAEVSEATWIANWVMMANRYKIYDAVIGMDLDNEPHGNSPGSPSTATWGNSNPATDWNKAAERCGNAILQANPNVLILVEGIELYNNDPYWWGGNLAGAATYPVQLSNPSKLVYSPHEYGPTVYAQPWFTNPAFPSNMPAIWDKFFGFLYNSNKAPLLVGEFGIKSLGGKDEIWVKSFLQYMGTKYSWTFWCFNPNSGDTGGIVGDDWVTPVAWKVNLLKPYLAPMIPNGGSGPGPVNQAPVANAGVDKAITLPTNSVTLNGKGTDSDGTITSYAWSQISGPNNALLSGANSQNLTAANLVAGTYTFQLKVTDNGGLTNSDNVNVLVNPIIIAQTPYAGVIAIPGLVEAENFDKGGENIAYHDTETANLGGLYRTSEGVDVENSSAASPNVGWINTGEWLEYSVNVATSGNYTLASWVASPSGGSFHIEMDGTNVSGAIAVPNTGNWQTWTIINKTVSLTAGQHVLRVFIDGGGFNLNKLSFTTQSNPTLGDGLTAQYFNGQNFNTSVLTRKDANINFNWGEGSPAAGVNVDGFSVRWAGQILPRNTGTYTFHLTSDNGRRLWVNNVLIIDKWVDDWDITYTGTINLTAGQKVNIKVEYFENWGGANAKLEWSGAGQAREVIPQSQLFSAIVARIAASENVLNTASLRLSPNPASDLLNLAWEGLDSDVMLTIVNAQGQRVHQKMLTGESTHQLSTASFSDGIYFVTLKGKQVTTTSKLVILH
ncbi:MAG: cellulase family glycosylhydrolase [Bacteroidota bacterium]